MRHALPHEFGQLHFEPGTAANTFPVAAPVDPTPLSEDEPEGTVPASPLWAMKERAQGFRVSAARSGFGCVVESDFVAKLVDVYPDGYEALVLDGPVRARYRDGRMPDQVKMMTPGAPEKLTIDLWNTAITFEAGHRIELVITSSNAPRYEVNRNNGAAPGDMTTPARVAVNDVYFDRDHPTALVLPVIYPDEGK